MAIEFTDVPKKPNWLRRIIPVSITASEQRQDAYTFFIEKKEREDIRTITAKTARWLRDAEIQNVLLVDTAARPMQTALTAYWDQNAIQNRPGVTILNPEGFRNRPQEEIINELIYRFPQLYSQHHARSALYDMCMHTGESVAPMIDILKKAGFTDMRIGLASNHGNNSSIQPDFYAVSYEPGREGEQCHPLGRTNRLYHKAPGSVVSSIRQSDNSAVWQQDIATADNEIRRIIQSR